MSQHAGTIANQTFPNHRADLNNLFAAIRTRNSGATEPTIKTAFMPWFDTSTLKLKLYNDGAIAGTPGWITVGVYDLTNGRVEPVGDVLRAASASGFTFKSASDVVLATLSNAGDLAVVGDMTVAGDLAVSGVLTGAVLTEIRNLSHPIDSLYFSVTDTNPNTTLGFGTWVAYAKGRAVIGVGTDDLAADAYTTAWTIEETGGSEKHKLTTTEMPSHRHSFTYREKTYGGSSASATDMTSTGDTKYTDYQGGNGPHNNMQPSIAVYIWRRTA